LVAPLGVELVFAPALHVTEAHVLDGDPLMSRLGHVLPSSHHAFWNASAGSCAGNGYSRLQDIVWPMTSSTATEVALCPSRATRTVAHGWSCRLRRNAIAESRKRLLRECVPYPTRTSGCAAAEGEFKTACPVWTEQWRGPGPARQRARRRNEGAA